MTARTRRFIWLTGISLTGLLVLLVTAALIVVQTDSFRDFVRRKIIEAVESSTGGKVELAEFRFEVRQLRATIRGFVLHGTEPANDEPLFRAERIAVEIRLLSALRQVVDISALDVDQPRLNLMVFPDGRTNIPRPEIPKEPGDKSQLETLVDLAVGRFRINDGNLRFRQQSVPFSAQGENLRAELVYERFVERYRGSISLEPLFIQSGENPRLNVAVNLPIVIGKNRIELDGATLITPESRVTITGSIEDFASPKLDVKAQGQIDLPELAATLGQPLNLSGENAPRVLTLNVDADMNDERVEISTVDVSLGQSTLQASGEFQNAAFESGALNVRAKLVVSELTRWLETPPQASGILELAGQARVRSRSDYGVDAILTGSGLSFRQGKLQVSNARLTSTIMVDPNALRVDPLRLDAAGGRISGRASLQNWNRYQMSATLSGFQLQQVLAATGTPGTAWGASISGPLSAEGELDGVRLRTARTNLSIVPSGRGIPLRGQVTALYDGRSDSIDVGQSYVAFPSSRLDFSGSMNQRMNVRLTSRDLNDFRPALALASSGPPMALPLRFEPGGSAAVDATLMGKLSSPVIAGHIQLNRFQVEDRRFDGLTADVQADRNGATLSNGILVRDALRAEVRATVGLRDWKPEPDRPLTAQVSIQNADVRDILVLAGRSDVPVRGDFTMMARASGTIGNPQGSADIRVRNGEAYGEPLDSVDGQVSFAGERVTLSSLRVTSNMASVDLSAVFDHPPANFESGTLRGHVQANQVALARIAAIQKQRPGLDGALQLNLDVEATLQPPETASRLELVAVNGTIGIRNISYGVDNLGDVTAQIDTTGREIAFRLNSNFAGSSIQANGRTRLAPDYPTVADLNIRDLPIEDVLKVSGRTDIKASGVFSARGDVSGTWKDPEGKLTLELTRAKFEDQEIDRVQARIEYAKTSVVIPSFELQSGPNRVSLSGSFTHPAQEFSRGDLKISVETNSVQLAQIAPLQRLKPELAGVVQLSIDATGRFDQGQASAPLMLSALSAEATARNLTMNGVSYGGLTFSAQQNGSVVKVELASDIAQSSIRGIGEVRMAANYPISAQVTLQGLRYGNWAALVSRNDFKDASFDALIEGKIDVTGPALQPLNMTGTAEFEKVEAFTTARANVGKPPRQVTIRNDGPVRLAATSSGIEIRNAHWTGPSTDVSLTGKVALKPDVALDVAVKADVDLSVFQDFDSNVSSEGTVALQSTITGPLTEPRLNGRLEMRDAAYQQVGMLNGISKMNGAIEFSGSRARIESLKAETGGGELTFSGDVTRSGSLYRFDLQGRARGVRVRTASGASVVSDATFQLKGTDENSLLSGDVNIRAVSFNSRTDFGSMLSRTSPPQETPGTKPGIFDAMRLNVGVRMGSATTFRTTFAENLEATADLNVRGTVTNPGILGRVNIAQGELVFFGTKYSVNEGTVSFYNPSKIEPILNLNLATTARGVNIVLVVTGPIQNMNLGYQSDPPLQFSEIVALLAVGKLPTTDAVLLAHQPTTPPQSLPQMGASALVGAAVTNPIAGQLQRVFGVSQLKIDPTFTSGSELPQVRLTLQQQITSDLTFTYVTNLSRADPQIIRAEWAIDAEWSAIATRQENGMVGVDLFYKKRFQ